MVILKSRFVYQLLTSDLTVSGHEIKIMYLNWANLPLNTFLLLNNNIVFDHKHHCIITLNCHFLRQFCNFTEELYVIVEYCKFGNLQKFIEKKRDTFISQVNPESGKFDDNYPLDLEILLGKYVRIIFKGSRQKKTADFEDIGIKGGWVQVSKPIFSFT